MVEIRPAGHNRWHVIGQGGAHAATLRWNGEHQVVDLVADADGGRVAIGTLYRSDGSRQADGSIAYTWRGYHGMSHGGGVEVARGARHEDAVAAVLAYDVVNELAIAERDREIQAASDARALP